MIGAVLTGCFSPPQVLTRGVRIEVSPQANDDSPVAVDVVVAYSDVALARVTSMAPSEWFEQRATILASFPNHVKVVGWELVPGQSVSQQMLPFDTTGAVGALVLARYNGRVTQRESVSRLPAALVDLGRDSMAVRADPLGLGESAR